MAKQVTMRFEMSASEIADDLINRQIQYLPTDRKHGCWNGKLIRIMDML